MRFLPRGSAHGTNKKEGYGALSSNSDFFIEFPDNDNIKGGGNIPTNDPSSSSEEASFAGEEDFIKESDRMFDHEHDAMDQKMEQVQADQVAKRMEKKERSRGVAQSRSFDPEEIAGQLLSTSNHGDRTNRKNLGRSKSFDPDDRTAQALSAFSNHSRGSRVPRSRRVARISYIGAGASPALEEQSKITDCSLSSHSGSSIKSSEEVDVEAASVGVKCAATGGRTRRSAPRRKSFGAGSDRIPKGNESAKVKAPSLTEHWDSNVLKAEVEEVSVGELSRATRSTDSGSRRHRERISHQKSIGVTAETLKTETTELPSLGSRSKSKNRTSTKTSSNHSERRKGLVKSHSLKTVIDVSENENANIFVEHGKEDFKSFLQLDLAAP